MTLKSRYSALKLNLDHKQIDGLLRDANLFFKFLNLPWNLFASSKVEAEKLAMSTSSRANLVH